jgi:hypothetical protein
MHTAIKGLTCISVSDDECARQRSERKRAGTRKQEVFCTRRCLDQSLQHMSALARSCAMCYMTQPHQHGHKDMPSIRHTARTSTKSIHTHTHTHTHATCSGRRQPRGGRHNARLGIHQERHVITRVALRPPSRASASFLCVHFTFQRRLCRLGIGPRLCHRQGRQKRVSNVRGSAGWRGECICSRGRRQWRSCESECEFE